MKRRLVRSVALTAGVLAVTAVLVVFALPDYPAVSNGPEPYPADRLAADMDPWLLDAGFADRTVIEVDWVEGCAPGPETIEGLRAVLQEYSPPGRAIDIIRDQEIPMAEWTGATPASDRVDQLARRYAGADRATPGTAWRYVLFVPYDSGYFGHAFETYVERSGTAVPTSGVVVARGAHRPYAKLWISLDRLERMTLIHEFGHLLGLVSNPLHERSDPRHRSHCTSLTCSMAHPTPRVIARNVIPGLFNKFITDYGPECRDDIRRAQEYWAGLGSAKATYRDARERKRQAYAASVVLWSLIGQRQYGAVLDRVGAYRRTWPDQPVWDEPEGIALRELGHMDEAIALEQQIVARQPAAGVDWRARRGLAQSYMAVGRYQDAIGLFDRHALSTADEPEFEQCAFVLDQALRSAGRFDEAVKLVDELLARRRPLSYRPDWMRLQRAGLLRRAGRLDDADAAVSVARADERLSSKWLDEAARLRHAQGRLQDERVLLEELLSTSDHVPGQAVGKSAGIEAEWTAIACLARLGRLTEAKDRVSRMRPPEESRGRSALWSEIPARAVVGDFDGAAAAIRAIPLIERVYDDPCQIEDLEPMRGLPQYRDIFPGCAEARARQ